MITSEGLKQANASITGMTIERKDKKTGRVIKKQYAMVTERIQAFRDLCPNGSIETQIVCMDDGVVTMQATIKDETGKTLATGLAQEKETSSYINQTSFIENAETSAVGRALGFCGIGVDASMASADEVANAMMQQEANNEPITEKEKELLKRLVERKGKEVSDVFPKGLDELTAAHYAEAVRKLGKLPDKS